VGIYVQGYGTFPASAPDGIAERLIACARSWAAERGLCDLFYGAEYETVAWLSFYPAAGGVEFELGPDHVSFGVKTSTAGPGYHAALIDLCDHLQGQLGIEWRWESGADQTNYAVDRNFAELYETFLDQVFEFCEFHRDNVRPGETYAINLPEGWMADGYDGVATPLGPVPARYFLDVLDVPDDAEALAKRIFPWWGEAIDEEFWLSALCAILWTEVQWRAARTPWERHVHKAVLTLGARLGNAIGAPLRQALDELSSLSKNGDDFIAPAPEGIGFLRRKRAFFLPGFWRINLPGYYIEQIEGNTLCLWFGDEEIRGTSFTVTPRKGDEFAWAGDLSSQPIHDGNGYIYRYDSAPKPSTHSTGFFDATAEFQTRDADGNVQLLILSLFSPEPDLIPRLTEIAQSVWFDGRRSAGAHGN
jgi:hypothetical protein